MPESAPPAKERPAVHAYPEVAPVLAFLEDSHVELAGAVGEWATRELMPRPEPADDGAARREARALLGQLAAGGWLEPIRAADWRACCLVRESLAAASPLADAVFALQALASVPIAIAGGRTHAARLADLHAGRSMGAFAMTEPGAGSDVSAIETRARRDGDHYVIDGRKRFISNAGLADCYVVFATTDPAARGKGLSAFVVPSDAPGVRFEGPQVLASPHPLGTVAFDGCRVPAANRLGAEGRGLALGLQTLDRLRPTVGAAACGMAARALAEAIRHAMTRHQFGQAIAEFQLVRSRLARMATDLAASRLLVYRAAWEADLGAARNTTPAAMAKAFATEAAQRIVDDAVQILGGLGVLAEHPVDRLYRSVRSLRIYEGTTDIQHLMIAGRLLAGERT